MANWVYRNFSSLYEPVKRFGGEAYFLLEDGFIKNLSYTSVPEIRWLEPLEVEKFGLSKGENIYNLIENLQVLRFLKEPQATEEIFKVELADQMLMVESSINF